MSDPRELISDLRSALAHMRDLAYLETHPLAKRVALLPEVSELPRGQMLRRILRMGIEALDPGPVVPVGAPEARSYEILRRHYVAKRSMTLVASELGIAERHAYRALRRGIEALAQILTGNGWMVVEGAALPEVTVSILTSTVDQEVARLSAAGRQEVDLVGLTRAVVEDVGRLARAKNTEVRLLADISSVVVSVSRVMLRQALLNLLSHLVGVNERGTLIVRLQRSDGHALLQFICRPSASRVHLSPSEPYVIAARLFDSLGIHWEHGGTRDGRTLIDIRIPLTQEHTVIIIDDNEGIIALFKRYLARRPYAVYGTTKATQALEMLQRLRPDVVILDVMMPRQDGWEVLHELRKTEFGRKAYIIVCSIIDDPELSAAIGADAFLHKPVDRSRLLQALDAGLSSIT